MFAEWDLYDLRGLDGIYLTGYAFTSGVCTVCMICVIRFARWDLCDLHDQHTFAGSDLYDLRDLPQVHG